MNAPWIIGVLLAIAFFAYFEWRAFKYPTRQNTLSMAIYILGRKWPISIFIMGLFCGSLATHLFWHWCPAGSTSTGMLNLSYDQFIHMWHDNPTMTTLSNN